MIPFHDALCYVSGVSKVQEIEAALQTLPSEQQWEVARWLLEELEKPMEAPDSQKNALSSLPNYAERRRRIFGDKVLPNMVLTARSEERW